MKKIIPALVIFVGICASVQAQKKIAPPPPPKPPKVEKVKFAPPVIVKDENLEGFYKANPGVTDLDFKTGKHVVVTTKDGKREEFNMSDKEQKENFEKKYGKLRVVPPPPPPAPPVPPVKE